MLQGCKHPKARVAAKPLRVCFVRLPKASAASSYPSFAFAGPAPAAPPGAPAFRRPGSGAPDFYGDRPLPRAAGREPPGAPGPPGPARPRPRPDGSSGGRSQGEQR